MTEQTRREKHENSTGVERLLPQLAMLRPDLANLPPVVTPRPYVLRTFREGDEAVWEKIVAEAFGKPEGHYHFDPLIRHVEGFRPEHVFFVVCPDGEPVATATGLPRKSNGGAPPHLHMVGVLQGHRGKKLGYWASLAAMHQLAREGAKEVSLLTDDFRLAAVKTYLGLGFEPYLVHENQRERWPKTFAALGDKGGWIARFSRILEGPVHSDEAKGE